MLRLKNATNDPQSMSQDGDAILRSLQNKNLPIVDLLVRESLQNSLDASISKDLETKVDYLTGEFQSSELADQLEYIENVLESKYPNKQPFLAIRDTNTFGLTGNCKTSDIKLLEKSNFHKLVFGIGKNQDKEGAGGSWGLGKTAFFRIGIGIVIYYTRVKINDEYEERLIASLIESPKSEERILESNDRGIAWWGDLLDGTIYPITDSKQISTILKIFEIERYKGCETGTTIIIPYINLNKAKISDDYTIYPWEENLSSQISMAIQRWYNPRLLNDKYSEKLGNSVLTCRVNNQALGPLNMEPIFQKMQELYNSALLNVAEKEDITVIPIDRPQNIMLEKNIAVGNIAFCEVDRTQLQMDAPHNKPSGLAYLGVRDEMKIEKNISKVIAYSRKPGMVVEYGIDDGDWFPHGLIQQEDHLLLAFFVPFSEGKLDRRIMEHGYDNLESYLRATESADHANWLDEDKITIVKRIKTYSKQAIEEKYQDTTINDSTSKTSGLSRKFGKILMPPKNFGKSSKETGQINTHSRLSTNKNRTSDIRVENYNIVDDQKVEIKVRIYMKKETISEIFCQVLTQDKRMNEDSWSKLMGQTVKYPFFIKHIELINEEIEISENIELSLKEAPYNYVEIENKNLFDIEVEAKIELKIISNQYIPNIVVRSKNVDNKGDN